MEPPSNIYSSEQLTRWCLGLPTDRPSYRCGLEFPIYMTNEDWPQDDYPKPMLSKADIAELPVVRSLWCLIRNKLRVQIDQPNSLIPLLKFIHDRLLMWSSINRVDNRMKFVYRMHSLSKFLKMYSNHPEYSYMVELDRKVNEKKNYWATVSLYGISESGTLKVINSYSGKEEEISLHEVIGGVAIQLDVAA